MELDPKTYSLLDKKIKNAQTLFCEKNIDLEVNEDKLVTEYFEITGGLTALWNGEEKQLLNYNLTYKIRIVIYEKSKNAHF